LIKPKNPSKIPRYAVLDLETMAIDRITTFKIMGKDRNSAKKKNGVEFICSIPNVFKEKNGKPHNIERFKAPKIINRIQ
tara:strand:+ start:170 stop:406 length:237 start_codon:yes stop_codon:yes gene_type:complete